MSAYLVNPEHIAEIVKPLLEMNSTIWNHTTGKQIINSDDSYDSKMNELVQALAFQNILSLRYRYTSNWEVFLDPYNSTNSDPGVKKDGSVDEQVVKAGDNYIEQCKFFSTTPTETKLNKLYGMVKCYEYQSCEDPQWTSTNAYHLCQYLKNYISDQLIDTEDTWDYRSEEKVI